MASKKFIEGMGVALVTPFDDAGQVDYTSLERLLKHQIDGGADFLVVHGTTGESPCLTRQERNEITAFVVDYVNGRCPIVVGLGGNDTLELGNRISSLDTRGLSGILSVVPYYNKPSQEGLYQHFSHLAERSPLPIILYNVPSRVGVNMMPETVVRLAHQHPSVIMGIKEASGYVAQAEQVVRLVGRDDFCVFSGDDNISVDFIRNGACGVISVVGNAYPRLFGHIIHLSMEGKYNEADMLQIDLRETMSQLFANGNPSGIKALLYQMGVIDYHCLRLPLVPVSPEVYKALGEAHQKVVASMIRTFGSPIIT